MSVQSYLDSIAKNAILKDSTITTSISTLQKRLGYYFDSTTIINHFAFGSNTRYTMLPRKYDPKSDVDYMVVFNNTGHAPQTYLNKLKYFVEYYYSSSERKQSHPTIKLNLHHITFELVPAIYNLYGFQIPAPANNFESWLSTNPNDFNSKLTEKNKSNNFMIKPLIRILKYWNASSNYVYESYELEQNIVNMNFIFCYNIKEYFYHAVDQLYCSYWSPQWKQNAVSKLKDTASLAKKFESSGLPYHAECEIRKILPEVKFYY
ncbi:MAG: nucleotidyltransferase [Leclercia adecarboxylata]|nr:nucleotidyltransferase [Leclercia adecarboxylata]